MVTQKSQYALRALFELARRPQIAPVRIEDLARAQAIPQRFLEVVLNELKHQGLVEARRGPRGGYQLSRRPRDITVADVVEAAQGRFTPVDCLNEQDAADCALRGDCVFVSLWEEVQDAVDHVYRSTTLQDLVEREEARTAAGSLNYVI